MNLKLYMHLCLDHCSRLLAKNASKHWARSISEGKNGSIILKVYCSSRQCELGSRLVVKLYLWHCTLQAHDNRNGVTALVWWQYLWKTYFAILYPAPFLIVNKQISLIWDIRYWVMAKGWFQQRLLSKRPKIYAPSPKWLSIFLEKLN